MSPRCRATLAAILLLFGAPLMASGQSKPDGEVLPPPPRLTPEQKAAVDSVNARFRSDQSCQEMTDGCLVCLRQADGTPGCSFPGIACAPSGWRCTKNSALGTDSPSGGSGRRE
jgi:hypothetical protein